MTTAPPAAGPDPEAERPVHSDDLLQLDIGGMSCVACARRIEKTLNGLDGVRATVNFATERAVLAGPVSGPAAVAAVEGIGFEAVVHDPDAGTDEWTRRAGEERLSRLRRRLFTAGVLTIPLCDVTIVLALVPGLRFTGWELVSVLLAVPVVTWAAWPFHRAAWRGLRHRTATMDTLVSLGITASFGWAVITLLMERAGLSAGGAGYWLGFGITPAGANALYLDVAAGLTTFQLAGRYFETRARRRAGGVMTALAALAPTRARVLREGAEVDVATREVAPGDLVVVRPGETVPVDGVVREGRASVDTSAMTGEPVPRATGPGSAVTGGTISTDGRLVIVAEAVGAHTQLAQMAALAEQAQARKASVQGMVDRIVTWFVPAVLVLSVLTLAGWLLTGAPVRDAFGASIAVLIIACPCALGLATPTALMVGVGRASQLGILIKGPAALEASGRLDTVVLDKTGTLTTGRMTVVSVSPVDTYAAGTGTHDVLRWAAGVETGSEHPLGRAVVDAARRLGIQPVPPQDFFAVPGSGVGARVVDAVSELPAAGADVLVGNAAFLRDRGVPLPAEVAARPTGADGTGRTGVLVAVDGGLVGTIEIADQLRDSAVDAVAMLRGLGLRTVLLTGDAPAAAQAVADEVGVDEVLAGVLPQGKADAIRRLQADGHVVAMVGDGVNDAVALAAADLGMAMVDGTDVALRSADVILVRQDLRVVADAVQLSRRTLGTIRGNLVWALGYNVVAIPLAAAGLLNPLIAAAAMSASSVLVVTNSLRLRTIESSSTAGTTTERPEEKA